MNKSKAFKWFRIVGHPVDDKANPGLTFVYFVEALKPQHVVKYYGGKRKYEDEQSGLKLLVQFSARFQDVLPMPTSWTPWEQQATRIDHSDLCGDRDGIEFFTDSIIKSETIPCTITRVIPATRYQCDCGEIRLSEFPYPSMWCSCGHKAYPLQSTFLG